MLPYGLELYCKSLEAAAAEFSLPPEEGYSKTGTKADFTLCEQVSFAAIYPVSL